MAEGRHEVEKACDKAGFMAGGRFPSVAKYLIPAVDHRISNSSFQWLFSRRQTLRIDISESEMCPLQPPNGYARPCS